MRMLRESYRSLLRPFGLDVQRDEDGDKMPPAAACLGESMVSRLSSRSGKWMKTRAVLTQNSLFLSKSSDRDQTLAMHRIPLHEITKIGRVEKDEGIKEHQAAAHGTRDVVKKNLKPDYEFEDSEPDEAKPEDLLEHTRILQLNTGVDGFNFGRTYKLRFKDDITMEEWKSKLLTLQASATRSYSRGSYIERHQRKIREFSESITMQYATSLLIVANFGTEALSLQFHFEYDTSEAQVLRTLDILFTLVYLLELLVDMSANLVWRFFKNPWSWFDLLIVGISLMSWGPLNLEFVKTARFLRVFRVFRSFRRIPSLRRLINALVASIGPVLSAMFLCTCIMMTFAMFGVNIFGVRSPEYFKTFARSMYTLFQMSTEGTAISREMMESDSLEWDVTFFFVVYICVEVFVLLPVVVAVLCESFSLASRRYEELEEKLKLRGSILEHMYALDPLLESLMSHTSEQDLTSKLFLLFQKFLIDDDNSLDFQELHEGLHKLSFKDTPPIKLTLKQYEHIAGNFFLSPGNKTIDFRAFCSIMREQLKIFCNRRLGEFISTVQGDSEQEAMKLFVFKLLIQEVDKLSADGVGFRGQEEMGSPVEQESILLGAFELLRGEVVEALTRRGSGSVGTVEKESADKMLAALQGIQKTVDDLSQRFSHSEQEREAGKKADVPPLHPAKDEPPKRIFEPPLHVAPLRNDEPAPAFQTSIHILSQRACKKMQAQSWQKRPAKGGQAPCRLLTGNTRAGNDQEREDVSGESGGGNKQAGQAKAKTRSMPSSLHQKSCILRASKLDLPVPVSESALLGDIVMVSGQWVYSMKEDHGSKGGVVKNYISAGPGNGEDRDIRGSWDPRRVEPSEDVPSSISYERPVLPREVLLSSRGIVSPRGVGLGDASQAAAFSTPRKVSNATSSAPPVSAGELALRLEEIQRRWLLREQGLVPPRKYRLVLQQHQQHLQQQQQQQQLLQQEEKEEDQEE